jgi:hypothetical protein
MSELSQYVLEILIVISFFAVSVWCVQLALSKSQEWVRDKNWWIKFQWYYGVGAIIFVIASVFVSFVIWLAIRLMGG